MACVGVVVALMCQRTPPHRCQSEGRFRGGRGVGPLDGFQEYFDWADIASPRGGTFTTPHWEPFTRPNGL